MRTQNHAMGFAVTLLAGVAAALLAPPATAQSFSFSTGSPDGRMAAGSRQGTSTTEIETADDFTLAQQTQISSATFTGLLPATASLSSVGQVTVEIYRVFPKDSTNPPSGRVPTRTNSPSDNLFDSRDSALSTLTFQPAVIGASFSANNSVLNGINPLPNQTTQGEGPVSGQEVQFTVNFAAPFDLPADHYFFVPQVQLSSGDFYWLSTAAPISPDLQAWIRNAALAPDWLRIGTDIVGGTTPPRFNMAFTLSGQVVPEPASVVLLLTGCGLALRRRR